MILRVITSMTKSRIVLRSSYFDMNVSNYYSHFMEKLVFAITDDDVIDPN